MELKEYNRKRRFGVTPEPEGKVTASKSGHLYIIQKHAASHLHYDFRLELGGALKSWAVPRGPSLDPSEKRLAVQVEDHPIEYGSFEGIIPAHEYGGGTVMLWDRGTWEPLGDDPAGDYKRGRIKFELHGEKLKGKWMLMRMGGWNREEGSGRQNWLLVKDRDEHAHNKSEHDITVKEPNSVVSGRSIGEIADAKEKVWHSNREEEVKSKGRSPKVESKRTSKVVSKPAARKVKAVTTGIDPSALDGAVKAKQPEEFTPELAVLVKEVPHGSNWIHEMKFDGYRILAMVENGKVRLITRRGNDWTDRFRNVAKAVEALGINNAILDGEVVMLTPEGKTSFQALQNVMSAGEAEELEYYVFDLPHCAGYDLKRCALKDRKEILRKIVALGDSDGVIRFSEHIEGQGRDVFTQACKLAMEGVVCKRADSFYEERRSPDWAKVKCIARQEFVIGGYTDPSGSREAFGALLIGYYKEGDLIYCGRVGTGFNARTLREVFKRMKPLEAQKTPFINPPRGYDARGVHWLKPELVGEIEFSEWTEDEILRHPSFQGLREDKKPKDIIREVALEKPEVMKTDGRSSGAKSSKARRRPVNEKRGRAGSEENEGAMVIAGVALSHPDKVLYPEQEITKRELAEYYEHVADWILPYVTGRPLSLVRCPAGSTGTCFFQKHVGDAPAAVRGIPIREKHGEDIYIVIDDLKGLVSLVQMGVLELHPWGCREDKVEQPDIMVFDLDPGPGVEWTRIIEAALLFRIKLGELGLESFVKTSGGKGLHVFVPLTRKANWDEMRSFSEAVCQALERDHPGKFLTNMTKSKRPGKIFLDFHRNTRGATCVAAYSTRARAGAPVSTPVAWEELPKLTAANAYTIANVVQRLKKLRKDPWAQFYKTRQSITAAMRREVGL